MGEISIKKVSSIEERQICLDIRHTVFVKEQGIFSSEAELDGKDDASDHYLAWCDNKPAGVARVRFIGDLAQIERVGVLRAFRGLGLGKNMMEAILLDLKAKLGIKTVKLRAQVCAVGFYEKLGFEVFSDIYIDAGISLQDMKLEIF